MDTPPPTSTELLEVFSDLLTSTYKVCRFFTIMAIIVALVLECAFWFFHTPGNAPFYTLGCIIFLVALKWAEYFILKYRIQTGEFGTNKEEAMAVVRHLYRRPTYS